MPSGPELFVAQPSYSTELGRAKDLLLSHPTRWRIIYHYDGDGIASASSAMRALARLGYPAQASPLQGVERSRFEALVRSTPGPLLVVDTGASWPEVAVEHSHPVILLDHHQYPGAPKAPALPSHVAFVNPLDWGVDGMTELSAATLTWLFSVFLDGRNWDNAPWGISGAIADRQHVGGFTGLNARLVKEAEDRSLLVRRRGMALFGATVAEAVAENIDPYVTGLSSRIGPSREFVEKLGIDPKKPPSALEPAEEQRLAQAILPRLAAQGTRPEFLESVVQNRWAVPALGLDAQEVSNLQNATGRVGSPGLGIALALGDEQAMHRARSAERTWRQGVLAGIRRLEDGGINSMNSLQWFESPDTTLAGTQAGLAMTYLLDSERPVFAFTSGSDGVKVSARGTRYLVGRGLDLAVVCRDAARAVRGEGGGHRVASGATIPNGERDGFLQEADRRVAEQLHPVRARSS